MKWSKLKIFKFSKYLIIISMLVFPLETNAKTAQKHLDSLEVVQKSLQDCSKQISDLLVILEAEVTTTPPSEAEKKSMVLADILNKEFSNINSLNEEQNVQLKSEWGDNVTASLSNIDLIVGNIENDFENETNSKLLSNETEVLKGLVKAGTDDPKLVQRSDYVSLIDQATNTQNHVTQVQSDVNEEYDNYDKQRKVTVTLSTLSAVIVLSLVVVMIVIYTKNKKKDDSSDKSSLSSVSNRPSIDHKEDPESPSNLYLSSQERFGIPRVKSNYSKSDQPSTSYQNSSLKQDSERASQIKY